MTKHRRILYLIARFGAICLMVFASMFVMDRIFTGEFRFQAAQRTEEANPVSHIVNCINLERPSSNPTGGPVHDRLSNLRVLNQSRQFAVISGGRDREGYWYVIVDFRHDVPRVFDARVLADVNGRHLRRSIASFQVTSAFRACGANYFGPVPVRPSELSAWFGDSFFDRYGQ